MIIDTLKKIGLDIVVIQETKKKILYRTDVANIWGSKFKEWVFFLPSLGRLGGMVMVWNTKSVELSDCLIRDFSLFVKIKKGNNVEYWFLEFMVLADQEIEWLFGKN